MDAFIGEIRLMAIAYIPRGWVPCDGRVLSVQQYPALASILGNMYGGNLPQYQFNLPDLRAVVAVGVGNDPQDQFDPVLAAKGGTNSVTLTTNTIPSHSHTLVGANTGSLNRVATAAGNWLTSAVSIPIPSGSNEAAYTFGPSSGSGVPSPVQLNPNSLSPFPGTGGAHENRQPYLALQYCICAEDGIYPTKDD